MALRAVIYTRVSSRGQVEKYSLPAQEKLLKECIKKEKQKLVEVYTDAGISGERIVDRPDFLRLLNGAEQKKFEYVWVVDQDRLSRGDLADLAYIKRVFRENNIRICTPYQKLTLSDIDDDFMSDLYGILAKRERLKIVEKANRGRKEKAQRGEWGGRTTPFGYDFDMEKSKYLIVNEQEKSVYYRILDLFLNKGYGAKRIAKEMNKQGYRSRKGRWGMQSILYILKNPVYAGCIVHQKFRPYTVEKNSKKRFKHVKDYTLIKSKHEPFITEETFKIIKLKLKENRNQNRSYVYLQLLTNILECAKCHDSFKVGTSGPPGYRKVVYRCKTRFAHWFDKSKPNCSMRVFGVDWLNQKVWERIQEVAGRPELIQQSLRASYSSNSEVLEAYEERLKRINERLAEFKSYKENTISLRVKNKISEEEFDRQLIELENEFELSKKERRELELKIQYLKRISENGVSKEAVLRYAKFLYQSGNKLNQAQKRKILEAFVKKVIIYPNKEFEIVFKFPIVSPSISPLISQAPSYEGIDRHTRVMAGGAA